MNEFHIVQESVTARQLWIDERLRRLPERPWRKVHLAIYNDGSVSGVGAEFNPAEFADTLVRAHVNAIVVSAKDVFGHCLFPSKLGPIHPGLLDEDLLGRQVAACREAGIKIYAHYPYAWDEYLAERHPEWLVWKRDRTTYLPGFGEPRFWAALCISHPGLLDVVLRHTSEVLKSYPVDGMWFDEVFPIGGECYCWRCLDELREAGEDPLDEAAQRRHKHALRTDTIRQLTEHVRSIRPEAQVEYNTQAVLGVRDYLPYLDNIDIECLPTGGWGYGYFPVHARYARTFGVSVYGMTGKFLESWADFGGIKHPTQLRTELAGIVAAGARCDVGDEHLPDGRLRNAVYETIGEAYEEIERLEPYLEGAVPVTEAAIIVDGPPLSRFAPVSLVGDMIPSVHGPGLGGMAKLLMERQVQFDVVDTGTEFERYRLLLLPDSLDVDRSLADRLNGYLDSGGSVIASHRAARLNGSDRLWADDLKHITWHRVPRQPTFARLNGELANALPRYADFDFALYGEADRWIALEPTGATIHAMLREPELDRPEENWVYPAAAVDTGCAVALQTRTLGVFSFALGTSYFDHGYWIYRELFSQILGELLPQQLVRTSAPQSAEVTVTHQRETSEHGARWIVHVVNYSPLRRAHGRMEYLDDPIPLHDVEIEIAIDAPVSGAFEARSEAKLAVSRTGERWTTTVPRIPVAAMVVFEERRA